MNRGRDHPVKEEWKDIKGFEGRYMVSNTGKILSLHFKGSKEQKCLKPTANERGYLAVIFYKKSKANRFFVHRLVAEAFLEKPVGMNEVNHRDGNKSNNVYTNLEWCTSSQNKRHGARTGLYDGMVQTVMKQMKPMIATNLETGEKHIFYSLTDAHNFMGGNKANISKVLHGRGKSCRGYSFQYIEGGEEVCKDLILSQLRQKPRRKDLFAISPLLREAAFCDT